MSSAGYWAEVIDHQWRHAFTTDELRLSWGQPFGLARVPIGAFYFGAEAIQARLTGRWGPNTVEDQLVQFAALGGWVLADSPGGLDAQSLAPELRELLKDLAPNSAEAVNYTQGSTSFGGSRLVIPSIGLRIRRSDGTLAGTAVIYKPAAGMTTLATMAAQSDLAHLARMQVVAQPARRPAAILFADLEASSSLARRLSTASYFAVGRRLVRAADQCVVDAGGLVGRHVGDGVVAFFLTETAGSESAAASAPASPRLATLRDAMGDVAARSGLERADVVLRFGLHWGSTVYVGQITTSGRSEVTALGDEVNEGARIEACASGGRMLASKSLVERLSPPGRWRRSASNPTTSGTSPSPTYRPRPRRPAATLRRSRSASSDSYLNPDSGSVKPKPGWQWRRWESNPRPRSREDGFYERSRRSDLVLPLASPAGLRGTSLLKISPAWRRRTAPGEPAF